MSPAFRLVCQRAVVFLAQPASARPLAALRIGLSAVLIVQAAAVAGHLPQLYGRLGLVQGPIAGSLARRGLPRVGFVADLLAPYGVSEHTSLFLCFLLYVGALHALLLGWKTRVSAILAWLLHLAFKTSGTASAYGVFEFSTIGLFYCAAMPCGRYLSLDQLSLCRPSPATPGARLALRVLQVHLCIIYLTSGIEKAKGEQWHNGEAIWRAVMRPGRSLFDVAWLASWPWVAMALCWATLVVEIGYAFMVWPKRTRALWAWLAIGLHVGIALLLGLWLFSAVMIVFTVSAFLVPATAGEALVAVPELRSARP